MNNYLNSSNRKTLSILKKFLSNMLLHLLSSATLSVIIIAFFPLSISLYTRFLLRPNRWCWSPTSFSTWSSSWRPWIWCRTYICTWLKLSLSTRLFCYWIWISLRLACGKLWNQTIFLAKHNTKININIIKMYQKTYKVYDINTIDKHHNRKLGLGLGIGLGIES